MFNIFDTQKGQDAPLTIIAGPCVIEDEDTTIEIAAALKSLTAELNLPFFFKASFDKANRSSIASYRGPGLEQGWGVRSKGAGEGGDGLPAVGGDGGAAPGDGPG